MSIKLSILVKQICPTVIGIIFPGGPPNPPLSGVEVNAEIVKGGIGKAEGRVKGRGRAGEGTGRERKGREWWERSAPPNKHLPLHH